MSMSGVTEGLIASILLDKSDPTRLTWAEIKKGWGSCTNFVRSYGLKDYDIEQIEEALQISRAIKQQDASPIEEED